MVSLVSILEFSCSSTAYAIILKNVCCNGETSICLFAGIVYRVPPYAGPTLSLKWRVLFVSLTNTVVRDVKLIVLALTNPSSLLVSCTSFTSLSSFSSPIVHFCHKNLLKFNKLRRMVLQFQVYFSCSPLRSIHIIYSLLIRGQGTKLMHLIHYEAYTTYMPQPIYLPCKQKNGYVNKDIKKMKADPYTCSPKAYILQACT